MGTVKRTIKKISQLVNSPGTDRPQYVLQRARLSYGRCESTTASNRRGVHVPQGNPEHSRATTFTRADQYTVRFPLITAPFL
jgi:hypothetical protein